MGLPREQKERDECRVDRVGSGVKEYGTEMTAGCLPTQGKITVFREYLYLFTFSLAAYELLVERFLYLYLSFLK